MLSWFTCTESNPSSILLNEHISQIPCGFRCFLTDASAIHLFLITYIQLSYYIVTCSNKRWKLYVINDWAISCISALSLFLTWLLDSTWSLHVFLRFQSTECWQNLQNKSSPDTYKSFGNCSTLYWWVNVKFLCFFVDKDGVLGSHFAILTLFWRGRGSVCGGGLLCQTDLLPSVQFSSDIHSFSTQKQHFSEII